MSIDFSSATAADFNTGVVETAPEVATEVTPEVATEVAAEVAPEVVSEVTTEVTPEVSHEETPESTYKFKDDFIRQAVEFYEKTGDLTPYLQAKTVDFSKMSDEEVMRRNLREQYSDLSDKAFDRLFKIEVTDKYKLDADEWAEEDSELGRELLKSEATKLRGKYQDWQRNFSAPEPEASQEQEEALEQFQKFEQEVRSNDLTRSLIEGKKLTIKTADGEFNYEIPQADSLLDMTINNEKFFGQFANPNGQLDYGRWYKTAAYSQNPEMFEKSLINFGKTLGRSEITKEIRNPSNASVGDVPTETSGDFMSGLLQAFASRGISK